MIKNVYSLKDLKSDYGSPMLFSNDELAIRAFKNMLADTTPNLLTMNPEDFELYCLGTLDTDSGILCSNIRFVFNCSMARKEQHD